LAQQLANRCARSLRRSASMQPRRKLLSFPRTPSWRSATTC
jgi:hypothetical protein